MRDIKGEKSCCTPSPIKWCFDIFKIIIFFLFQFAVELGSTAAAPLDKHAFFCAFIEAVNNYALSKF